MSNHYHLLVETPEANLVAGMKWLQGTYTQRFHLAHGRNGHLFQGRYKALIVDPEEPEYFLRVSTYIHLNPFRAGLCGPGSSRALETYQWSSYPQYLKPQGKRPTWLEIRRVLESLEINGQERRERARYRRWIDDRMLYEFDPKHAEEVRGQYKPLKRGWCLGSDSFRERVLDSLQGRPGENLRGNQRRDHGQHTAEVLLAAGLERLGLREADVLNRKSTDAEKQALAWLLTKHTTVTGQWVAQRLSMGHRVNASRAIRRFDRAAGRRVRELKQEMLQCTV